MEKRTTIYLDDEDNEAIKLIQEAYVAHGFKITASAAIRLALRETGERIKKRTARASRDADKG